MLGLGNLVISSAEMTSFSTQETYLLLVMFSGSLPGGARPVLPPVAAPSFGDVFWFSLSAYQVVPTLCCLLYLHPHLPYFHLLASKLVLSEHSLR